MISDIVCGIIIRHRMSCGRSERKEEKGNRRMNGRDRSIDILRGMGIVLMIAGHIGVGIQPYEKDFSWWYHAFHMPMFYIISGYFFDSKTADIQALIARKTKTLLIPYAFWGMFHILYNYVLLGDSLAIREGIRRLFVDPTISQVPIAGALWFLPALFWVEIIYYYVNIVLRGRWTKYAASMVIGACGMIAAENGIHLPMALDAALVGVAFAGTGALLRDVCKDGVKDALRRVKGYVFVMALIAANALIFCNSEVNFRSGKFGYEPLAYINAVLPTIVLWKTAVLLDGRGNGRLTGLAVDALASIGRESIIYVCLNQWMIKYIMPVFISVGSSRVWWQLAARGMTLVFVCFVCSVVMKVMTQNLHLKRFVGK